MSKPLDLQADVERLITVGGFTVLAHGAAAPTDGTAGYAKGCIFIDTTGAAVYVNEGTTTSCDFDLVSVA